jgi:hypothetical protein
MSGRLDVVSVKTSSRDITIPFDEIDHLDSAAEIAKAFNDVGANSPAPLA